MAPADMLGHVVPFCLEPNPLSDLAGKPHSSFSQVSRCPCNTKSHPTAIYGPNEFIRYYIMGFWWVHICYHWVI